MGSIIWFTGLSGSGKTTLALALAEEMKALQKSVVLLDGDSLRQGLSKDLGFSEDDRLENVRRASEIAKMMCIQHHITIVSMITPTEICRDLARTTLADHKYFEVFLDCPIEVCVQRDPKGLYQSALKGDILDMTGIQSKFERPQKHHLTLSTTDSSVDSLVEILLEQLKKRELL